MKRWKFSLESVRLLKNRLEEEAAQKHAQALVAVSRAKAQLAETEREINAAALMQFAGTGKKAAARDLAQLSQYVSALEKQRRERLEKVLLAEREVTLARAALEKVAREREILDKLRDKQHAAHQFHIARQEQKWVDELAQQMKRGLLSAL
jgi:flagellar export protein FliJ